MSNSIEKIVIVGGGSAGWMSASLLAKQLSNKCQIILVESDDIGTVGVGEATINTFKRFNKALGLDEKEFLKATNGTFKLGIQFKGWQKDGKDYFHPFGEYGVDFDAIPLHYYWLKEQAEGRTSNLDDYAFAWHLAKNNKFSHPQQERRLIQSTYDYGYHFDATLYANYLRKYSEKLGVKRVEGIVEQVKVNPDSNFIENIKLKSGEVIAADLFIDCTGFKALLIDKTLKVGFDDWSHWLPCNKAWAVQTELTTELTPYTKSIAQKAGWHWRIPLQNRVGNGHVFCDEYIDDKSALDSLLASVEGKLLTEPRLLKFKTGKRKKIWHKNCVAIGLSAGFLEPLESTSLHLIQQGITRLLALFPDKAFSPLLEQEYNRITSAEYESIRDFLILHYCANEKKEHEFWRHCANMELPETLQYKIDHFKAAGHIVSLGADLFKNPSWLAVFIGQGIQPKQEFSLLVHKDVDHEKYLASLLKVMKETADSFPSQNDFIKKYLQV